MWLGVASSIATTGLSHRDNGICVIDDRAMRFAISEERVSRKKHDCNADLSLASWIKEASRDPKTLASYGVSSCSDEPWSEKRVPANLAGVPVHFAPSHHYSHALSAFHFSPFESALVLVMDAGGNTIADHTRMDWWTSHREQTSLWLARAGNLALLERLHFQPLAIGFGEWYRAITYFLGWQSHTLSGNTMALSAFGDPSRIYSESLFDVCAASPKQFPNDPRNPCGLVDNLLMAVGRKDISRRLPGAEIESQHEDLAAYCQWSLEETVLRYVGDATRRYTVDRLCLSGGVAQNCVLNAKVATALGPQNVYISPIAGDVGQCVGNALHARACDDPGGMERIQDIMPFWGITYSGNDIREAIRVSEVNARLFDLADLARKAATNLADGRIIALFEGRSEFGPRALGHRSVLCDPHNVDTVSRVKRKVKCRDDFMPLAPAISMGLADELRMSVPVSETMVYAPRLPDAIIGEFGVTAHIDRTARLQAVGPHSQLGAILAAFETLTGRRVLVNTSFNPRGAPIVESPADAIQTFRNLDIDALIMDAYWITR